jgi:hypothetical protein
MDIEAAQLDTKVRAWRKKTAGIVAYATYLADKLAQHPVPSEATPSVVGSMRKCAAELPGVIDTLIPLARGRESVAREVIDDVLDRYEDRVEESIRIHLGEIPPALPAARDSA